MFAKAEYSSTAPGSVPGFVPTRFLKENRNMPQKYSPGFKVRALQLLEERTRAGQGPAWVACTAAGKALGGVSPHTLQNSWKQDGINQEYAPGISTAAAEEITKLRRENHELRRSNEILCKASAFFAAELEASHDEMPRFIDENRGHVGAEAFCRTVGATECGFITSRAYQAAKTRQASAQTVRDEILIQELTRVREENYSL